MVEPALMSPQDVADCFRVSVRTVRRWRNDGTLPPPLFSRHRMVRWRREVIEACRERIFKKLSQKV